MWDSVLIGLSAELSDRILVGLAGFSFGFGVSSVLFLRVVVNKLDRLHADNVEAAKALHVSDRTVTRKVEEQNMDSVKKRLDEHEAEG